MYKSNVKGAHFLTEDISLFDVTFFNFSADVAAVRMLARDFDWRSSRIELPRVRILKSDCSLISVYKALENGVEYRLP